jgi:hypothetical protein
MVTVEWFDGNEVLDDRWNEQGIEGTNKESA